MLLYYMSYRPVHDLKGLNAKQSIAVTFHCIVPKWMWVWDEASSIYMRFEGDALGNWEQNVGIFKEGRFVILVCE